MKFTIERLALLRELRLLSMVVERKTTIPILSCLRLSVEGGALTLTGTDLDSVLHCYLQVSKSKKGVATVDARILTALVAATNADEVSVELTDTPVPRVKVTAGKATWELETVNVEQFPDPPEIPVRAINIPFDNFRAAVNKVMFVTTKEQSRFTLSGVKFVMNGSLTVVATDGHRLALATDKIKSKKKFDTLIPVTALKVLNRFPHGEFIGIGSRKEERAATKQIAAHTIEFLSFEVDSRILITRAMSGNFPNYELVLPKAIAHNLKVDAIALERVCREAETVANNRHKGVRWTLEPGGLSRFESGDKDDRGAFKTELVTTYAGKEQIALGFNNRYVLEACKLMRGSVVDIGVTDSNAAVQFETEGFKYVVMPLRI